MKRLLLTLALIFSILSVMAADITPISNAFKGGDASTLTGAMDQEVDMALPGSSKKCSGSEAVKMLSTFFGSNKPSGFSVVHHADKKDAGFFVGKLPTASGEYRVNITYRAEDIGDGDHTTLCCIPETAMGKSQLIIKEDGVLAGVEMAKRIFHDFDPELKMTIFINDGAEVKKGDIAFTVEGKVQSLLQTERLMLNVMQRMSGIATTTRKYVKALEGTKTRVLDTRKTTPGMRMMEKDAVKIGGGVNHRIGLFDMILLKDNHVDFAGGIEQAITRAQNYLKEKGKNLKIEIEVRNFDELQQAMNVGGIDRIMLDNFNIEDTKKAVEMIGGRFETESSGGITFDTLRDYAECGVDFISVGALTHSVKSLDMSLKAC